MPRKKAAAPNAVPSGMTRIELFRSMKDRLRDVRFRSVPRPATPERVKRAEKVCAEWNAHVCRVRNEIRERREERIREIQNELIRGNTLKALDLLIHLEAHE